MLCKAQHRSKIDKNWQETDVTTLKILLALTALALAGLVGFAYFGDMRPEPQQQTVDISVSPAPRNGN